MTRILGIIPARLASTRFPAKALVNIEGKTMVRRVYEQAIKASRLTEVFVATDHEDIYREVESFGGKVQMTSPSHPSGTDRCAEVSASLNNKFDYIINIQGDEPFIKPEQIDELAGLLDGAVELATLVNTVKNKEDLFSSNIMKVIFDRSMNAIYFSREPIPHVRGVERKDWLEHTVFYKHVCMYAYRSDILKEITSLPLSNLEKSESLEQLRWIENGYKIRIGITEHENVSIDTPSDLEKALKIYFAQEN